MNTSRIAYPECVKDYATRRGLKKHLLSANQLVFVDFSNETRQPTPAEFESVMLMLRRHQSHNK